MKDAPPQRLIDDPSTPQLLREDLQAAKHVEVPFDTVGGLAALERAITAGTTTASRAAEQVAAASSTGAAGASLSSSAAVKLALSAGGLAALTAVGVALLPVQTAEPPSSAPNPAAPSVSKRAEPADSGARSSRSIPSSGAHPATRGVPHTNDEDGRAVHGRAEEEGSAAHRKPVAERRPAPRHRAERGSPPAGVAPDTTLARETAELARIKRSLDTDPASALRWADAGHARFGTSVLYPEREALAVLALSALDRRAEAVRRGRAFVRRYPAHPMRTRVEAALERMHTGGTERP